MFHTIQLHTHVGYISGRMAYISLLRLKQLAEISRRKSFKRAAEKFRVKLNLENLSLFVIGWNEAIFTNCYLHKYISGIRVIYSECPTHGGSGSQSVCSELTVTYIYRDGAK